jgi:hypothetical protein
VIDNKVSYAGVGNISGTLISAGKSQGMVRRTARSGSYRRRGLQFEYAREPGAHLIMYSDGISGRWESQEPHRSPGPSSAIIAASIYRDHGRARDDATIVVVS